MAQKAKAALYMGIKGVHMIWHGEWADPELRYKHVIANYHDVEDSLWETYKEECSDEGRDASDSEFPAWCRRNADLVKDEVLTNAKCWARR